MTDDNEVPASRAERAGFPVKISERAQKMRDARAFLGGPLEWFETVGRLQLATLIQEGLNPSSKVLDVGCGSLRAGYWLMNFLEPGRYFGINPRSHEVEQGLQYLIEPELAEYAKPRFAYNDNFDLAVFGVTFDFVLARSIWSHTSKAQIQAMLDSFLVAAPDGVLLTSYLPASKLPDAVRIPLYKSIRAVPGLPGRLNKWRGHRLAPDDYKGDEWDAGLIGHDRDWVFDQCRQRGLAARELDYFYVASQKWLRIEKA